MSDKMAGIRLKTERANDHINEVHRRIERFMKDHPHAVGVKDDPKTAERIYHLDADPIPFGISVVIGEAIHQLRSSLDHLACLLVESGGGTVTNDTAFPICDLPAEYEPAASRKIKGVSDDVKRAIEAVQPYNAGYEWLGAIRSLNNIDKHRLLLVCGYTPDVIGVFGRETPATADGTDRLIAGIRGRASLKHGDELARLPPDYEYHADFTVDVAFAEPPVFEGQRVLHFLAKSAKGVNDLVTQFAIFV